MGAVILGVRDLGYDYPGGIAALSGCSLDIERGEKLAVLGANGCGKTTLFLHLNGTLRPRRGDILLDGRPAGYDRRALRAWRRRVGLVLQDPDDQLFAATVVQDVSFGPCNLGLSEAETRRRIAAALGALGIPGLAERPTHMLSFGQKRRVAIAGILAMRPELVVLDEPFAGLDPQGARQLLPILDRLNRDGTTLVFSTHDVDLAYAWADRVAILAQGRVACAGAATEVLADPEALGAAGLEPPLLLDLARELRVAGIGGPGEPPPRPRAELIALLRGARRAAGPPDPRFDVAQGPGPVAGAGGAGLL